MLAGQACGVASVDSLLPSCQVDSYVATLLEWNASMNLVSASQATRELVRLSSKEALQPPTSRTMPSSRRCGLHCCVHRYWSATLRMRLPFCPSLRMRWGGTARAQPSDWLTSALALVSLAWCSPSPVRAGKSRSSTPWQRCTPALARACSALLPRGCSDTEDGHEHSSRLRRTLVLTRLSAAARSLPGTCGRNSAPCKCVLTMGCAMRCELGLAMAMFDDARESRTRGRDGARRAASGTV